jgi:hypothetical protein
MEEVALTFDKMRKEPGVNVVVYVKQVQTL